MRAPKKPIRGVQVLKMSAMTGRIITVRHGRPDLSRDIKMTGRQFGDWWAEYDRTGLAPGEAPSARLVELGGGVKHVLSSSLPRAIETAAKVTGGERHVPADPLFVEAPLPGVPLPLIKLTPKSWGVVSRTYWVLGYAPGETEGHSACWKRVHQIVERLKPLAADGDVMLCAHGYLNWMIGHVLKKQGWDMGENEGGHFYWSWRVYSGPATDPAAAVARAAE